ncbi:hypothetical protein Tco_0922465 [Tanacetum coccineum]|uniref:Uncharacterized protein n=1 Tax=Tanacetum coccineum TaxID=301880 RepID=A0ABQ5CY83_9ASTR
MMMCKQAEQGVPLQADWLEDTYEDIDEQELEAHYSYMAKIQEKDDSNVTPDSSNICNNDNQVDQNAVECVDERDALANLTLDTEENKTILKQLKKANASLTQELEKCKTNLDETNSALGEAISCRDSCLIALQNKQNEFEKYKAFNDRTIDYEILQTKLNETLGLLALKDIEIKEGLKTKAYEISVLNQKHDELVKKSLLTKSQLEGYLKENTKVISDLKVKEEKDIDKMIEMDKQLKFLNEIVYTRNQSIQTIHMLAPKCSTYNGRPTFANPRYLKKAQSDKPCLYEIPYDTSDPANRFAPDREETMTLDNESRSKLNKDYVKPYDYTRQNSLYEIFKAPSLEYLYQLERAKEVRKTMWRKPFVRTKPNIAKNVAFLPVSKSISKSRQVFNEMTFNINQFREIVDQTWFKHTSDYFWVPTAHDMELLIKTLLMPLSIKSQNDSFRFEHELKTEMHEDYEYVKSLEKEVDELESEKADFSNIYDLLLEECVSKDVTCSYLHSLSDLNAYTELQCLYLHKVKECECLALKLSKQTESVNNEVHNKLLKSYAKLEKHSISLELSLQHYKASKLPLSFWVEAVATACYTQTQIIFISTHGKDGISQYYDRRQLATDVHEMCMFRAHASTDLNVWELVGKPFRQDDYKAKMWYGRTRRNEEHTVIRNKADGNSCSLKVDKEIQLASFHQCKWNELDTVSLSQDCLTRYEAVSKNEVNDIRSFRGSVDPGSTRRDEDICSKNLALLANKALWIVQKDGIQLLYLQGDLRHVMMPGNREAKRVKDSGLGKADLRRRHGMKRLMNMRIEDTDEEIDEQELEAHYSYMAKIQEVSPAESSSTDTPLEQVQNHDENDVFANVRRHSEQPESINDTYVLEKDDSNVIPDSSNICTNDNQVDQNAAECVDERAALANLIANLTLDTEENKTILKQLKKANASLTQELKECKTNLDESSRALGEATSSRDSSLIALQTKQTELEKYTALNDLTSDYKILQTKLNETLGLLALKDIDIKEGLKTKTYEISVVNQKHDELVKKSLLTRSQFEGQLKEKTKVISDLKVKEGKDIDTMIEMDKQIKFLNEILYKRNQSIQTIHMLAPKCATYNGRSTFANPKYLKKAQSEKPRLYEIPYDTSDPANRFCPNGEETVTLEKESRSKLDKDKVKPYDYSYQNSLYETFKPPSKTYLDQLERAKEIRKTMWRKTFVRTKPNIAKNVGFLPMSKSISKSRLLYNEMTNNFNHFRTICQQTWSNHTSSAFPNPTAKTMEVLIKTLLMPLSNKTILDSHCFVHELKKEMNDDLEYVNSLEKELDELESEKADFSNIYDLLLEECVSKDVTCSYLHSLSDLNANTELQCLYLHKVKECECLAQKLSKQTESVNKEMKNNPVCKENASNVFRKEREQYHEIQDLKAQMQDKNMAINKKQAVRNTNVIAPGPSRNCPKHVSHQSPREKVGSNDMVYNYYLEKAKKSAQLQKDKEVNGKPSMIDPARLPNTANGCKPKPRNWQASMSSRVSNKDVHLGEHRKQKPFLKFNELQCPTCKKCLYSANHDECVLEYLSRSVINELTSGEIVSLNFIESIKEARSRVQDLTSGEIVSLNLLSQTRKLGHSTMELRSLISGFPQEVPVEKSSASKKPERQISTGHRTRNSRPQQRTVKFKAGSNSCSSSKQDIYITTRVEITIPPSHSNAEDNSMSMLVKDIRSQDGKDDKDNDKGSKSRSQSMKEQAYNKEQRERPRPHELNDKSNLTDLMKECHQ